MSTAGASALPANQAINLAVSPAENAEYEKLLEAVSDSFHGGSFASACFILLYHRWVSAYRRGLRPARIGCVSKQPYA